MTTPLEPEIALHQSYTTGRASRPVFFVYGESLKESVACHPVSKYGIQNCNHIITITICFDAEPKQITPNTFENTSKLSKFWIPVFTGMTVTGLL